MPPVGEAEVRPGACRRNRRKLQSRRRRPARRPSEMPAGEAGTSHVEDIVRRPCAAGRMLGASRSRSVFPTGSQGRVRQSLRRGLMWRFHAAAPAMAPPAPSNVLSLACLVLSLPRWRDRARSALVSLIDRIAAGHPLRQCGPPRPAFLASVASCQVVLEVRPHLTPRNRPCESSNGIPSAVPIRPQPRCMLPLAAHASLHPSPLATFNLRPGNTIRNWGWARCARGVDRSTALVYKDAPRALRGLLFARRKISPVGVTRAVHDDRRAAGEALSQPRVGGLTGTDSERIIRVRLERRAGVL